LLLLSSSQKYMELLGSNSPWLPCRSLYCSDTGRFSQQYVHNYQHAASYPALLVSGNLMLKLGGGGLVSG